MPSRIDMALRIITSWFQPLEKKPIQMALRLAGKSSSQPDADLPAIPKRAPTAYMHFIKEQMPALRKIDGNKKAPAAKLMWNLGSVWRNLSEDEKQKYKDRYQQGVRECELAKKRFESLDEETRQRALDAVKSKRLALNALSKKRQTRLELIDLAKPRRPVSSYLMFALENYERYSDRSNLVKNSKLLGKRWKEMPDSEKSIYVKRYNELLEEFYSSLAAWEQKMLEAGRADLVRASSRPPVPKEVKKSKPSQPEKKRTPKNKSKPKDADKDQQEKSS